MCLADGHSRNYFLGCETTSSLNIDSGTPHMRCILGSRERWELWLFLNAIDSPLALPKRQASATVVAVQGCKRAYHPSVTVANDVQSSSPILFSSRRQWCAIVVANAVHSSFANAVHSSSPILFIPRRQYFSVPVANNVHSASSVMFSPRRQCPPRQWSRIWSPVSCALLCNARHWKNEGKLHYAVLFVTTNNIRQYYCARILILSHNAMSSSFTVL